MSNKHFLWSVDLPITMCSEFTDFFRFSLFSLIFIGLNASNISTFSKWFSLLWFGYGFMIGFACYWLSLVENLSFKDISRYESFFVDCDVNVGLVFFCCPYIEGLVKYWLVEYGSGFVWTLLLAWIYCFSLVFYFSAIIIWSVTSLMRLNICSNYPDPGFWFGFSLTWENPPISELLTVLGILLQAPSGVMVLKGLLGFLTLRLSRLKYSKI